MSGIADDLELFEASIRDMFTAANERFGADAMARVVLKDLLRREAYIRANYRPDHPAIALLDRWHEQQRDER